MWRAESQKHGVDTRCSRSREAVVLLLWRDRSPREQREAFSTQTGNGWTDGQTPHRMSGQSEFCCGSNMFAPRPQPNHGW